MQNKCDLAQEMYETIIETPNVPNSIRANAYKQLGEYKLCQLKAHVHPNGFARLCFCFETILLSNAVFWLASTVRSVAWRY